MPNTQRQYRPIADTMTCADDALSVRTLRDFADNLNNYFMFVGNHKTIGQICVPEWKSHSGTTDERVIVPFAWRHVPDGHRRFALVLHHYRTDGSGSVTWRMYCSGGLYSGDVTMDTSLLLPGYSVGTITTSESDIRRSTDLFSIVRGLGPYGNDVCWFVLTAQNSDGSTRGAITSIDLWPYDAATEAVLVL